MMWQEKSLQGTYGSGHTATDIRMIKEFGKNLQHYMCCTEYHMKIF